MGPGDFLDKCHPNCDLSDECVLWGETKWRKVNKEVNKARRGRFPDIWGFDCSLAVKHICLDECV